MWREVAPEDNEDLGPEVQCSASLKREKEQKGKGSTSVNISQNIP